MVDERIVRHLKKITKKVDTPFYLIDLDKIKSDYDYFYKSWKNYFPETIIAYSYKSNSLKAITQLLRRQGSNAEVVSGTELNWALEDGYRPECIYFNGPLKSKEELFFALSNNVNIQIDSIQELNDLIKLKSFFNKIKIAVRLSGDYKDKGTSRFGINRQEFKYFYNKILNSNIEISGIHIHIGSNLISSEKHVETLNTFSKEILLMKKTSKSDFWVNIGGGFPSKSIGKDVVPESIDKFAHAIRQCLNSMNLDVSKLRLILEPGRCLVEDNGYLITSTRVMKKRNGRNLLVCDSGLHLTRSIHSWYHPITFLDSSETDKNKSDKKNINFDLFGYNCFESDLIAKDLTCYSLKSKEIIIGSCGSYDIQSANAWIRPLPPIYGILNGGHCVLRLKQTSSDIRKEQTCFSELVINKN